MGKWWGEGGGEMMGSERGWGNGGEKGVKGVWRWGEGEIIYLSLHCYHQNDFSIKMGGNESHFNVS